MPISEAVYMVTIDGKPHKRNLTKAQADAYASEMVNGFEGKRASDKRRIGCFEVKLDKEAVSYDDGLYHWAKQGGLGNGRSI